MSNFYYKYCFFVVNCKIVWYNDSANAESRAASPP